MNWEAYDCPLPQVKNMFIRRFAAITLFIGAALPTALIIGVLSAICTAIKWSWSDFFIPCWNGEIKPHNNK